MVKLRRSPSFAAGPRYSGTYCLANWWLSQWRYIWNPFHRRRDRGAGTHVRPVVRRRRWAKDGRVVDYDGPLGWLRGLLLRVCWHGRPAGGEHGNGERYAYELHDDDLRCLLSIYGWGGHIGKGWMVASLNPPLGRPGGQCGAGLPGAYLPLAQEVRTTDETHRKCAVGTLTRQLGSPAVSLPFISPQCPVPCSLKD